VEAVVPGDEYATGARFSEPGREIKIAYSTRVTPQRNGGFIEKLSWTLDPTANYPCGCQAEDGAMDRILATLKEFEIWFFKPRSSDMFPNAIWPRSVLDIDDLESRYERSKLRAGGGLLEDFLTKGYLLRVTFPMTNALLPKRTNELKAPKFQFRNHFATRRSKPAKLAAVECIPESRAANTTTSWILASYCALTIVPKA
jgi:hypothetical protein